LARAMTTLTSALAQKGEPTAPARSAGTLALITLGIASRQPSDHPQRRRCFIIGVERIRRALERTGFRGGLLYWTRCYPAGSPTHEAAPYAFKPFGFAAARREGYDRILWMDASVRIKSSLAPLFDLIARDGYLIFNGSHSIGEYCKDEALATLGLTREESFQQRCCSAAILGLDLRREPAREFLRQWTKLATDGITFPGPKYSGCHGWPRLASADPRVKGHRHDQTAASAIALKLGMNRWHDRSAFTAVVENQRRSIPHDTWISPAAHAYRLRQAARRMLGRPGLAPDGHLAIGGATGEPQLPPPADA
jgi:hypothetical protein